MLKYKNDNILLVLNKGLEVISKQYLKDIKVINMMDFADMNDITFENFYLQLWYIVKMICSFYNFLIKYYFIVVNSILKWSYLYLDFIISIFIGTLLTDYDFLKRS